MAITSFRLQWKAFFSGFLVGGLVLLLVALASTVFASTWRKIIPGVRIANLTAGAMTGEDAADLLNAQIKAHPKVVTLFYKDQKWQVTGNQVDLEYNLPSTINTAWVVGRSGTILERLGQISESLSGKVQIPLVVKYDQDALTGIVASISAQIEDPGIPPVLKIEKKNGQRSITINPGKDGHIVDRDNLAKDITSHWANLNANPVEIKLTDDKKALSDGQVKTLQEHANQLLGKDLTLIAEDNQWKLSDDQLINLLNLNNPSEFDRDKLATLIENYATGIDRDPQNAAFQFTDGKVTQFRAAKDGVAVKQGELADTIENRLPDLLKNSINIQTPLSKTTPEITTESVNNLGIKELLGRGVSYYSHSIPNRVHNVDLTASRINGAIIKPGDTFSFDQTVGDISRDTGYLAAYIIKDGHTVLGDGGGVCQVSTTVFRAALNTGLPIIERHGHAYRVGYYEQNSPVGIDATVFSPTVDLRFKNDTPAHLLVQAINDPKNYKLVIEIYGTSDGRKAEVGKSQIWDQTPPPPDVYQDDPTLPAGTTKQIDFAAWGAKTSFTYKVTRGSDTLQDKTFYTNYQPWQAVYLRGTKQ